MEEEVTEPDPQTAEPTGMLPSGTHSEVNGDLPGNPYLRDGVLLLDVMESPAREADVLQDPAEYSPSRQCGVPELVVFLKGRKMETVSEFAAEFLSVERAGAQAVAEFSMNLINLKLNVRDRCILRKRTLCQISSRNELFAIFL
ncbi:uncharacterized protein V6R79_025787 [Siganus canaliculatus]